MIHERFKSITRVAVVLVLAMCTLTGSGCVQETSGLRFNEGKGCWEGRNVHVLHSGGCDDGGTYFRDPDDGSIWSFDTSCIPDRFVVATPEEFEPIMRKPNCYEIE